MAPDRPVPRVPRSRRTDLDGRGVGERRGRGREADPGARRAAPPARGSLEARRSVSFARPGARDDTDHGRPNRAPRARAGQTMAEGQAPRAPERTYGVDQPARHGPLRDRLAHRRRPLPSTGDRLPGRSPRAGLQGRRGQTLDPDPARPVLRRGIDRVAGRRCRRAVRTRIERSLQHPAGVRRRPRPDRPARTGERRRRPRQRRLPRLRAPRQRRDALAGCPHRPRRAGHHHKLSDPGLGRSARSSLPRPPIPLGPKRP